jgi:hypothetical protein
MNTFDSSIKNFLLTGEFANNIDDLGNIHLNTEPLAANEKYIGFYLKNYIYDKEKIESLYDINIAEFSIPEINNEENTSTSDNISMLTLENNQLKEQLNLAISSSISSNGGLLDAAKDIIVKLRIKLGEGTSTDDFSDSFPYLKK